MTSSSGASSALRDGRQPQEASQAQALVLASALDDSADHWYLPGPVRSGKTYAAIAGFLAWLSLRNAGQRAAIVAKTERQLLTTLMTEVRAWAERWGIPLRRVGSLWELGANTLVPVIAAEGTVAVERVRGMTLAGALIDEATSIHRDLAVMLTTRCSVPGARTYWTCNPGPPLHWFRTEYLLRNGPKDKIVQFTIDDNPVLSDEFKSLLRSRLRGVDYERLYLGRWAAAAGQVWPQIDQRVRPVPQSETPWQRMVALDHADSGVTHALLGGRYSGGRTWVTSEWRWHDHTDGLRSSRWKALRLAQWARERGLSRSDYWIIDPAAQGMRAALLEAGVHTASVVDAWNPVLDGVQAVQHQLGMGRLYVSPDCRELLREAAHYTWDEGAASRGEDRPQKGADHGCDALRYLVATMGAMTAAGRIQRSETAGVTAEVLEALDRSAQEGRLKYT